MTVPQTNSYKYFPTSTIMENYTTCPPWPESTGKNHGFRKSVTCEVLVIYWFPDCGIMVPTSLIKQSSSAQLSPESDKPFSPQSNITKEKMCHTPYEKKNTMKVSLLSASQSQSWLWFSRASCIHIKPQWLYHLATSCSSLVFKCRVLNGLRSLQKK